MPGSTPPTSQLDWLSSTTAMIVLLWSRATRDLLKSFGWGIVALHRLNTATKLPSLRRPPHRSFWFRAEMSLASRHHPRWDSGVEGHPATRSAFPPVHAEIRRLAREHCPHALGRIIDL